MSGAGSRLKSLNSLLQTLASSNPFYRERIRAAGLEFGAESVEAFCRKMPFTTKHELVEDQRQNPPYGTNLTFPIEQYTRYSQTSGTTGTPMRWPDTAESWSWMVDNWVEVLRAAEVGPGDRIFFAFSFGPFIGFWLAFEAGTRLGCLCIPGGGMTSAARLQTILDNRATVLCCTPTYALRLAEVAREEGIDLTRNPVRSIVVAGEPGASIPATRALIESGWPGARVFDHHGMTEVGPVTYECPQTPGILHVMETAFAAEVIDPASGEPAEEGEFVLSTLGRTASPVLRYRTGDFVRKSYRDPCRCGRSGMVLEGGILGRTDDMVVIRGVNVHPSALEEIVRRFPDVVEYRVEVFSAKSLTEIHLEIEPSPDCTEASRLAREVESALRTGFNLRVPTRIVPCGTLPRFELKARRWNRRAES
jgi:phenylacetate-CoA ligase